MNKNHLQQGDVLLTKVNTIPVSATKLSHLILAEGESTGHKHEIHNEVGIAELYEEKGTMYLSVQDGNVVLYHEEHNPITIEEGQYIVGIVNEYDYDTQESGKVQD